MQNPTGKPVVVPAFEGRPLHVIGNEVTQKLTFQETNGAYYVFEAVTPPGGGVPPHVHRHEDEVIYVLEGEYEFMLGAEKFKATAGAVINFPGACRTASPVSGRSRARLCGMSFREPVSNSFSTSSAPCRPARRIWQRSRPFSGNMTSRYWREARG